MSERPHLPQRPLWLCRVEAHPWPCAEARLRLARQCRRDRVALCLYLGQVWVDMVSDLYRLHPDTAPEPGALAERVFGWLPSRRYAHRGRADDRHTPGGGPGR